MKSFFDCAKPTITFEIFPPKGTGKLDTIFETIDSLAGLSPDLISVTYGAGGTSRENTAEIASAIENSYGIPALAHLTCIGSTKAEIEDILLRLEDKGIKNILALRGDRIGEDEESDFRYASDLIAFIKERHDFNIFAACYPEKHIEAYSAEEDLENLKKKVDCGVDVLVSQLFFSNDAFYDFKRRARDQGITVPILAGIMPITSGTQIARMVSMCGASVPDGIQKLVMAYDHNRLAMREAGIAYAAAQIVDLLACGVDGVHLYTMNRPETARRIVENIRGIIYALRVKRG